MGRRSAKNKAQWKKTVLFLCMGAFLLAFTSLVGNIQAARVNSSRAHSKLYAPHRAEGFSTPLPYTVYLTFDDGPSPNTEKILDILSAHGANATFFVTGQYQDQEYAKRLLQRMAKEGHSIGLHSYTHRFAQIYSSADTYLKDIDKLRAFIQAATGIPPAILRFPGGSRSGNASPAVMKEIIQEVQSRGYMYYDWDIPSGDDSSPVLSSGDIAERVIGGIRKRGEQPTIVLLHDNSTPVTTPDAVEIILSELAPEGYQFKRITPDIAPPHRTVK
jgi:Predicted xylanase/chitin deacetylase